VEDVVNGKVPFVLVVLLISSPASLSAGPLTRPERDYVALMTLSIGITNMCDGYDVDDTNVLRFADSRAVNISKLGPATLNAIEAIVGADYDKTALIPEVTQVVQSVSDAMSRDVSRSGKAAVCDRYGLQLTSVGFLRTR
jgi:hypothetical protein